MGSSRAADKKLWKKKLDGKIKCVICPLNKGENANRQPKPDFYKSKRKGKA